VAVGTLGCEAAYPAYPRRELRARKPRCLRRFAPSLRGLRRRGHGETGRRRSGVGGGHRPGRTPRWPHG